ncbi:MAG: hypothetical protein GX458_14620 [Phyllobacteriaceae bacterium]|nr:hypothetical protein [Phyllobacteriaceae bacterium]
MHIAYAIDVHHQTAGVAVGEPGDFKFFSSGPAFDGLEGRIFRSLEQVSRAARELAVTRRVRGFASHRR